MKFGLLLPHFGASSDRDLLFAGAKRAEELGFHSLWVRDHVVFEPHGEFEEPNRKFLEALTTLTAIGAVTNSIQLGTGALIPFRHPITTALSYNAMAELLGNRFIAGIGAGNSDDEFAAVGLEHLDRRDLVMEHIEILKRIWSGESVTHHGSAFNFENVKLEPVPSSQIPIWYCGNTPASVRRSVLACDGWLPGRIGFDTLAKRVQTMQELSDEQGRARPNVGIIPATSVDLDREKAISRVNVGGLLKWANNAKYWVKPPSGKFETLEDLRGVLLAGNPQDIVEGCEQLGNLGVDHLVFDFRMDFTRWLDQVELLAEYVLPSMRASSN